MVRFIALNCLLSGAAVLGQVPIELDETCAVTVGNQSALVRPDGSFLVQNISVFQSRVTGVAPQLYRVRATCLRAGNAITGQSEFFELTPGQMTFIVDVLPSDLDPIPTGISVSAPGNNLGPGASMQLTVVARFPDRTTEDRTFRTDGTTYLSTNPSLLTVTEDGIVTGQNSSTLAQTGMIAVLNEGNLGTISVTTVPPSNDLDGDGMPNDFEDLFGLNKFFNDANLDLDSDDLTNIQEFNLGTLVNNPDTDADGLIDGLDGDPLHPDEIPPTVVFTSPSDGDTLIEGQTILVSVDATDNGLITSVELSTDTSFAETLTTPPFETDFMVPNGVTQILFTAVAADTVPNVATATVTINVIPDPLTTVIGSVVDPDGLPVDGAALTTNGGFNGTSLPDGSFSIPDVPTILGDIVVEAIVVVDGLSLRRVSAPASPVVGGVTDVGAITLKPKANVGYYDLDLNAGNATQINSINVAGHTPIDVGDLNSADLSAFDVVIFQNPRFDGYSSTFQSNLAKMLDFVEAGGVFVFHDRHVDTAESVLPGNPGIIVRDFSDPNDIDILDATTQVSNGPGGDLTNTSLDGGNFSTHGFAVADSIPPDGRGILSRSAPEELVLYTYRCGAGFVVYSSIPLDFYLAGLGPSVVSSNFRNIYAPNVVAHAVDLRFGIAD